MKSFIASRGREERIKGSYVLIIENREDRSIEVGKLGVIHFRRGFYAYTGSAMGGIEARLDRHLRQEKRMFWHIDYILAEMNIVGLIFSETKNSKDRYECAIARRLASSFEPIESFGSSDCRCRSHLFYSTRYEDLHAESLIALIDPYSDSNSMIRALASSGIGMVSFFE